LGFNAGAVEPEAPKLPLVIANTVVAAAFGSASGMLIGFLTSGYIFKPGATINGLLGGLVAITAGCTVVDLEGAAIIGIVGGSIAMSGSLFLLHVCKIDDPVDVIAVHGLAGVSGTLMVALVAQPDALVDGSRIAQLLVQVEGIAINFAWAFTITIIAMRLFGKVHNFRVSDANERLGLNSAEHGVTLGIDQMRSAIMKGFSQHGQDESEIHQFRLEVNEGEENADVALAFNTLLDKHGDTIENLDKMRTRAEEAARAKSEFLANMSHEIRTPMNGVMGMAELLANTNLDAKQRSFTEIIVKSGQSLLTILNDILDFSKIEAGKMKLDPAPFDLAEIVEDVGTLVSSSAAEKDVEIIIRIAPDVPKTLEADAGRIRQILHNLAGNAVKFTTDGHVFINVASYDKDLQRIRFEVQDTGVGIPEEKLAQVFDKFSQVDNSATRKHDGTGLGLSICSALVSMMNGEIGVTSKEGKGSTFWFEIECPAIEAETGPETQPGTLAGKRILVIDDNAVNQRILSEMLGEWEVDTAAVSSGPEGLAMLEAAASRSYPVDCVILDYQMPLMTGSDVLKRIRANAQFASLPVVVLSSVDHADNEETFRSIGANAQLTKPVRSAVIRSTLEKVLSEKQSARTLETKSVQGIKVA
ncbi:MAG: ATP-binding protein, partial [Pseudomonadota bacterium]